MYVHRTQQTITTADVVWAARTALPTPHKEACTAVIQYQPGWQETSSRVVTWWQPLAVPSHHHNRTKRKRSSSKADITLTLSTRGAS